MALGTDDQDGAERPIGEASGVQTDAASVREPAGSRVIRFPAESGSILAEGPSQERGPDGKPAEAPNTGNDGGERRAGDGNGDRPSKGFFRRHPFAFGIGLLLLVVAAAGGYLYWDNASHFESTDDAFIAARQFSMAAKVSGYITAVPVTDNQHVITGDVIARIDQRDYLVALEQASAQAAQADANIQNIDAQIAVQQAQINVDQAQVQQAQANLEFAQDEAARYQDLVRKGAGTVEQAQQYTAQLHQQQAAAQQAQASVTAAQGQINALQAQRKSAVASLDQAKAQREQAQLNLSYTIVTAAQPGHVVNLTAAVGQFAPAGTALTMFVPDQVWVTANFKETQLHAMRPGQPATIQIDAYPERTFHGHVASVQPGSGTAFSLLPAENATGNYVKIVQRVPVKLVLDSPPTDIALGPGMSVVPIVRTDPAPSLYERLRGCL